MRKYFLFLSVLLIVSWNVGLTGCGQTPSTETNQEQTQQEGVAEQTTPEESTSSPDEPVSAPDEPISAPDEPVTTPEEPTSTPDEPVTTPDEPTTTPDEPASTPDEPVTTPDEPTTTPDEPTSTPDEPVSTPDGGETVAEVLPESSPEPTTDGGTEIVPETVTEPTPEFSGTGPDPASANQITAIRAGTVGKVGQVAVTYLKPKLGSEPAGFFVQATLTGPALFVAIDPATTTPPLKVGDVITFEVTKLSTTATSQTRVEAETIKDLKVISSGYDVTKLSQDVSTKNDLVSALDSYSSELIQLTGKVKGDFTPAGTGFLAAQIETNGVTGNTDLKLRVPDEAGSTKALNAVLGLVDGCEFSTTHIPMWRFRTTAQPSAFNPSEITIKSCPAPKLVSAKAINATTVELIFSRPLDKATIKANGSDFTFDNGLSATAAVVNVNVVTVTTSAQDSTKTYKVTASAAIKDDLGKVLDSTALTATFKGFNTAAVVLINEVNVNIANGCDLVELRVKVGGSMDGFVLYNRGSRAMEFKGLVVKKNDIIVVHFDANDTKCYPTKPKDETQKVDEVPAATVPTNYDTAWDWYSTDSGISGATTVLDLRDAQGNYLDGLVLRDANSSVAGSSITEANKLLTAKQWTSATGTPPASYDATTYTRDAVADVDSSGSAPNTGKTIQRKDNNDTNSNKDWTDQEDQTFGKKNKGQTDF